MKILTIIVSYNFTRWIKPCLESLSRSDYPTDVLVIDNGSQDDTVQTIRGRLPACAPHRQRRELRFRTGEQHRHAPCAGRRHDAVFLLNQDAWMAPDSIGFLAAQAEKTPRIRHPLACTLERNGQPAGPWIRQLCASDRPCTHSARPGRDRSPFHQRGILVHPRPHAEETGRIFAPLLPLWRRQGLREPPAPPTD